MKAAYPWRHGCRWDLIVREGWPVETFDSFQAACQAARKVAADILADVGIDTLQDKPTGEPDDRDAELWIVAESEDSEGVKECMTVRASDCAMRSECAVQAEDLDAFAQWLVALHGLDGIC